METKKLYDYVLDQLLAVVVQLKEDDYPKPTPDTKWDVRDLLGHIMTELTWLPDMVNGRTVEEVGSSHEGDLLGADPVDSIRLTIDSARQSVKEADLSGTAHLSYADKQVSEYLLESADDLLVHAWDLGQAIGVDVVFDEPVAKVLYEHMEHMVDDSHGLFGTRRPVGADASYHEKLLGLLGRSERWREA